MRANVRVYHYGHACHYVHFDSLCSPCVRAQGGECAPAFSVSVQLMSGGPPLQQAWQSVAMGLELPVFSW